MRKDDAKQPVRIVIKLQHLFLLTCVCGLIIFLGFNTSLAQQPTIDYLKFPGNLHKHSFPDTADSLSSREIVELRNEKGLPEWFGRDFNKVVCLTGQCRMVHLWLFWDGAGNYLGFQLHEKEPLSKTDHSIFKPEDYQKLHWILADSLSVLKSLKQEDLIIKTAKNDVSDNVDAHSGATQPSLQEYLVRNAAYTCYTLWHTVYGNTRDEIFRLLEQRADSSYLQQLFTQNRSGELRWAIGFIKKHPEYHSLFYRQIISQIKSKEELLSQQALDYFDHGRLAEPLIQKELGLIFNEISYQRKFELIWKLSVLPQVEDDVVLTFLQLFNEQRINASLLGYVYKLIRADNLKNPEIVKKLKTFAEHENLYVRNISRKLLPQPSN